MGKINQAKKLLRHLKISKLISNTSEWRQLFESFLRSLLIHNFTPMLAIDAKARIWADKNFTYAVAYILGIPRYVPHGLIQLMTNMSSTDESVQEQLIKGGTNINSSRTIRQAYLVLEEIFHLGGLLAYINKHGKPSRQLDQLTNKHDNSSPPRHHFNPEQELVCRKGVPHKAGNLVWLVGWFHE